MSDRIKELEEALEDARLFARYIYSLGSPDCEVYKNELISSSTLSLDRISKVLDIDDRTNH